MHSSGSIWQPSAGSAHPTLRSDLHVDVAIIGGGITGVTAALLLKQAGKRVVLLERRTIGSGVTGGTTAHITEAIDTRYTELEKSFGPEGAALARESSRAAIEQIAALVARHGIDCDFERVPGYLYAEESKDVDFVRLEQEAAARAGASAQLAEVPLPFPTLIGLRFANQAQFEPLKYVTALAALIPGDGSFVCEQTPVIDVDDGEPCRLHLEHGGNVYADQVIFAIHAPLTKPTFQLRLPQYRSYVISGPVARPLHALFWDTADPYRYLRSANLNGEPQLIIGGEDHKTGQGSESDPEAPFRALADLAGRFQMAPTARWSAQVVEPPDGLPYIGRDPGAGKLYIATGYSGNGMTFGTLAGMMLRDAILGKPSPYADLYDPERHSPLSSIGPLFKESVNSSVHMLKDRLRAPGAASLADIGAGEGKIVRVGSERLAVYREPSGAIQAVSAICTHMGCQVAFNAVERTWDCPCHGSRFATDGSVLDGPATKALRHHDLTDAPGDSARRTKSGERVRIVPGEEQPGTEEASGSRRS